MLVTAATLGMSCCAASQTPMERNRWQYIVIHHSASHSGNSAGFHRLHRAKGWDGLAYHFVITNGKGGPDGGLEVGSRWWHQKHGAHAGAPPATLFPDERNGFNEFGIGICLVGNLEQRPPTRKQMETLAGLITRLRNEYGISPESILGHRHVRDTACPGRHFPWGTLYARLELPPPTHLYRHTVMGTTDRCPWCIQQILIAESKMSPSVVPPASASGKQGSPPDLPGSEIPPPILLRPE
jgi:N-acetylmuramoyl-L-alanine amidase